MVDTMSDMAKPKKRGPKPDPESKRSRGENRYINPRVVFHPPADILDAVDKLAEEEDRSRSAQLTRLLRMTLQQMGRLPPKEEEP